MNNITTTRPRRRVQFLGATLLAAAALTLAGCSASTAEQANDTKETAAAASTQTKAEGCEMIQEAITSMSSITPAADASATDIGAALDTAFAPVYADLEKITNDDLKPVVTDFTDALRGWTSSVGEDPSTVMSGPAFEEYTKAGTALGSACQ